MTTLPEPMGPSLTVTLAGLASVLGGVPEGTEPTAVSRTATILITPLVAAGTVIRYGGIGYVPEPVSWLVGPDGDDWPFSAHVLNLADPDVDTDATQYRIRITLPATAELPALTLSGVLTCPVEGGTVDLLDCLSLAAASPTSPVVRGDPGPIGPPGPDGTVVTGLSWSGPVALDAVTGAARTGCVLHATLTGNVVLTLPTLAAGTPAFTVEVNATQDGTGGRTLTVQGAMVSYGASAAPVLSSAAGAIDKWMLEWDGVRWWVLVSGQAGAVPSAWAV
ncbi:hypothetical protein [Brooklawnia cerclae]|uniref:Uncharacterized protein n=1 Tax=Brooklawnia cerclae TaxID=349934 RepID=A0ABX0SHA0_9ACTN|nr:hypothetical protein [Brooklawnia cerclae]NIH57331.1 hypothetical protein [Brooklawnia cerclae]